MHSILRAAAHGLTVVLLSADALAQPRSITLDQALSVARERSGSLTAARVNEARGELTGAQRLLSSNPTVEAGAGARVSPTQTGAEFEVSVQQSFELGGKRAARIESAQADLVRAGEAGEDARRLLLRDVAVTFLRVLYAQQRLHLATAANEVAAELEHSAERRFQAGDLPVLDYHAAVVAHARATAEQSSAAGEREAAMGALRGLLGLPTQEVVNPIGELRPPARPALAELLRNAQARPDLKALRASIEQAEAEERLGSASAWPEVGLGAQYKREGQDHVVLGLASITLPVFDRGQGLQASARARASRLRLELETAQRAVATEIEAAFESSRAHSAAAEALQRVAPRLEESDGLALKAFTAGEISLRELLLLRQQVLEARLASLNQQFSAAAASVELRASAGVLQ